MGHHIKNGKFKSDKYSWCPEGFFVMKFTDPDAKDPILLYSDRTKDLELAEDLKTALLNA